MAIVSFDIETTGIEQKTARIVQISLIKFERKGESYEIIDSFDTYISPGSDAVWSEQAMRVNGITPDTVKSSPGFSEVADKILDFIGNSDILTYNGNTFDIPILKNELARIGKAWSLYGKKIYDSLYIESKISSRKLVDVYKRYTGKDLNEAHNSLADARATIEVFCKQMELLNESELDTETTAGGLVGMMDGEKCFLVGKYRGRSVKEIIKEDPSYITYFIKQGDPDFYLIVKDIYNELKTERDKNKSLLS